MISKRAFWKKSGADLGRFIRLVTQVWFCLPLIFAFLVRVANSNEATLAQSFFIIREGVTHNYSFYTAFAGLVGSVSLSLLFSIFYRGDQLIHFLMLTPLILGLFQISYAPIVEWRVLSEDWLGFLIFSVNFFHRSGWFLGKISFLAITACYLPDGFETTSFSLVSAVFNLAILISGSIQSMEYSFFGVKGGYLERIRKPIVLGVFANIGLSLISPFFFLKISQIRNQMKANVD